MDCDEKLADATSEDLQRSTQCSLAEEEKEEEGRAEEKKKERTMGGREIEIERKRGGKLDGNERERERERMALGFFRGRDFETCLSALKSREIKEVPRPKPGEHVRMREDDEEALGERRTGRCRGYTPKDGPAGQERSLAKSSSYTHRDSLLARSFVPHILVLLILLLLVLSVLSFYRRPAVASFNIPPREECAIL